MIDPRVRIELEAVAGMIEGLDYYQALRVQPNADRKALERAFVTESRKFHPDRFQAGGDPQAHEMASRIFRRISEAWSVLRDPQLRAAYDRRRASGRPGERITKADLQADAQQPTNRPSASTPQGKRYLENALQAERTGDLRGALMQGQFAAMAEPGNQVLKAWIEDLKRRQAGGPAS